MVEAGWELGKATDTAGKTPLQYAKAKGHAECARALEERKRQTTITNPTLDAHQDRLRPMAASSSWYTALSAAYSCCRPARGGGDDSE